MERKWFLNEDGVTLDSLYDGVPGNPIGTATVRVDEFGIPLRDDQGNIEEFFMVEGFELDDGWIEIGVEEYRERTAVKVKPNEDEDGDDDG